MRSAISLFAWLTVSGWTIMVLAAAFIRGRPFATMVAITGGVYSLIALAMAPSFSAVWPIFLALHLTVYLNFIALARPRVRSLPYRLLISWPAAFFLAGTLLALPWALAQAVGLHLWLPWLPYAVGALGLVQSLTSFPEEIDVVVGGAEAQALPRPHPRGESRVERPLRIVQISDPHIGPFMSVERLQRICQRAVERKPDLVLLTGDFLTMESQRDRGLLTSALAPLKLMPGQVFACPGNHDHEAPATVAHAMHENGIKLLVDEAEVVQTVVGPVQVVGMDFTWGDRRAHLAGVCRTYPRLPGVKRLILLHDPGAFKHLPEGEGDLVLSGHTHGGQVGLVSLGLSWTFLRLFGLKIPDHGFWARGRDRLYVHRGTGHYGFPLRLGVPAEESLLRVHWLPSPA